LGLGRSWRLQTQQRNLRSNGKKNGIL
jgi:hypothetical protein